MKKKYLLLAFLSFFIVISANGETKKLKLGYIEFPPFTYTDSVKKPNGILLNWASQIFSKAGYTPETHSLPVLRLIGNLVDGKIDIWMGLKSLPQFQGTTFQGNVKVFEVTFRAYTLKGTKEILKKEDLKGTSVIILKGYSYGGGWVDYIKNPANNIRSYQTNKHTSALKMLMGGRGEYLLDYKAPCEAAQKIVKIKNLNYTNIKTLPIYFIVSKKLPTGNNVLKNVEGAFTELKNSGKLVF